MQPPQNPYEGLPNPNDPIPPHIPGNPNPYGSGVPARGPEISFDAISQAWTVMQPNLGTYVGAALIAFLVIGLFQVLQTVLTPHSPNGKPEVSGLAFLVGVVGGWIYNVLIAGMTRMSINHLKTGRPELGQMFSVADVLPSLILASILVGAATLLGFCLCFIPGLLLVGLYMFVIPLIVDRRLGALEAMRTSFQTLRPQMWMALIFMLVVGLVSGAGAIACGVGALVTMPLGILAIAITYRNFFPDGGGYNFPTSNPPTAPIADPRF